jgi:hypothetical protein
MADISENRYTVDVYRTDTHLGDVKTMRETETGDTR